MKILLIYPYFIEDRIQAEEIGVLPIGIYSVAAVLKENHYDVEILNWYNIDKTPEKIREVLQEKKPEVIGLSILNGNRWGGIEIARTAKQLDPSVKVVFGGIGPTFLWEHFLTHFSEVDFVVIGEGDYTFPALIRWLEKGDDTDPSDIKGIAFRKKGKAVNTGDPEPIEDLDGLPVPAKYFDYQHVSSTRGCPWKCSFCGSPGFWGQSVRFRSPEHFVEELEILYRKGITFFYVSDDTFTLKKDRVIEICKRIIEKAMQIAWYAISRVNCIDEEILSWMRKAGCVQISYGVESGSEKIRKLLNKRIETDQVKKAFRLTTDYGILSRAYFIYGSPGETWETIGETIALIHDIKPLSTIFYILDLFPGTELYERLRDNSVITDDVWLDRIEGIMYYLLDPDLSEALILAFGKKLRSEYYDNIHRFTDAIHLIDREDLYEKYADFYSRLAMTFSHGDYSRIAAIREKEETAEKLYLKSLDYSPNHRAYLGLGILKQKSGASRKSIQILSEGIEHFPDSEALNLCLGISHINLQEYEKALSFFLNFPHSKEAIYHAARCYNELGDSEKEMDYLEKAHMMKGGRG